MAIGFGPAALGEFGVVRSAMEPPPLMEVALPSVGPKTDVLIMAHRHEYGAFARLEKLLASRV